MGLLAGDMTAKGLFWYSAPMTAKPKPLMIAAEVASSDESP